MPSYPIHPHSGSSRKTQIHGLNPCDVYRDGKDTVGPTLRANTWYCQPLTGCPQKQQTQPPEPQGLFLVNLAGLRKQLVKARLSRRQTPL